MKIDIETDTAAEPPRVKLQIIDPAAEPAETCDACDALATHGAMFFFPHVKNQEALLVLCTQHADQLVHALKQCHWCRAAKGAADARRRSRSSLGQLLAYVEVRQLEAEPPRIACTVCHPCATDIFLEFGPRRPVGE